MATKQTRKQQEDARLRAQHAEATKRLFDKIIDTLEKDGVAQLCTYTQYRNYDKRHIEDFRYSNGSAYVRVGKRWECIDFTCFKFYLPAVEGTK